MGALEQTPAKTPMQQVLSAVRSDQFLNQVANALPGNVTPERFVRCAVTAIQQNPGLITADRDSLFQSIVKSAQAGLLPDGREAALVEVKIKGEAKVQFWPMVGGYRKIAAKHGYTLVADVVRQGDYFDWSRVPPRLEHRPTHGQERGEPIYAYAVAFDRDWRFVTAPVVLDVNEIEKIRAVSRAAKSEYGPWVNWWDRMACKTATRRLFNELPLGDLDELAYTIREAGDQEAELPATEPVMSVEEANLHVNVSAAGHVPDDGGPDDEPPEQVDGEVVGDDGQTSFADQAETAQRRRRAREMGE